VSPPPASSDPSPTNSAHPIDLDVSAQKAEDNTSLQIVKKRIEKIRLKKQRLQRIQELEELEEQSKRQILATQIRDSEGVKYSDQGGAAKSFG
jgi:hypothetical protein